MTSSVIASPGRTSAMFESKVTAVTPSLACASIYLQQNCSIGFIVSIPCIIFHFPQFQLFTIIRTVFVLKYSCISFEQIVLSVPVLVD
jgi:hypothetical protein